MLDMKFSSPRFTWSRGLVHERLDRFLCNEEWYDTFPNTNVLHLAKIKSDNRPFLLIAHETEGFSCPKAFKFLASSMLHLDWNNVVKEAWKVKESLMSTIANFQQVIQMWNSSNVWKYFS